MLNIKEEYQEHIIKLLKNNPNRKVYITGHSLGGAVATIERRDLSAWGLIQIKLKF